jgi:hypothetical protein
MDLGGFREIPIMEDYEMAQRCRKLGRLVLVDADCTTSARAWHNHGLVRVTLTDALFIIGYRLGIGLPRLARWRGAVVRAGGQPLRKDGRPGGEPGRRS